MRRGTVATLACTIAVVATTTALVGCGPQSPQPDPSGHPPAPVASGEPAQEPQPGPVQPAGTPVTLVTGLTAPWSILRLTSGSTLISERNSGQIVEYTAAGEVRTVGTVTGVVHQGEGGLLGIEGWVDGATTWVYAYLTTASDNRIVRMTLDGDPGSYSLGAEQNILTGLEKAGNHNGGRIKIGPDNLLYATVGDAGDRDRAQDVNSLNGKILRMRLDGSVPDDNPFPGSLVYSLGHRNPQGLAWDASGQLWASEFGQNTWDELNRIEPGKNYGWPIVEGTGNQAGFVDPVHQWATSEASPSGLAYIRDTFFMASLRGQRLWAIYPRNTMDAVAWFEGEYGRLRDAVPGPDGSLWVLTNNTDGRGSPKVGDDKLLQVRLEPLREG